MMNFQRLGWIVAAAVVGMIAASGFQSGFDKVASVDLNSMVENSDFGKANIAVLEGMKTTREDLLKFIDDNRVLTVDQAKNLRTLWIKDAPTTTDKASLETLKSEIVAQAKKNIELSTKTTLTPEERTLLQEYSNRSAAMEQLANQWFDEFRQEIQQSAQQRRADTLVRAKAACKVAAVAGTYTLVVDTSVAVYAVNDLTPEALKAMNAKK